MRIILNIFVLYNLNFASPISFLKVYPKIHYDTINKFKIVDCTCLFNSHYKISNFTDCIFKKSSAAAVMYCCMYRFKTNNIVVVCQQYYIRYESSDRIFILFHWIRRSMIVVHTVRTVQYGIRIFLYFITSTLYDKTVVIVRLV